MHIYKWLIGIDEVGRGPLAGPVAVCAFAIRFDDIRKKSASVRKIITQSNTLRLSDSKKLNQKEREVWFSLLKEASKSSEVLFTLSYASAKDIDTKGIAVCIRALIKKNLKNIQKQSGAQESEILILLDGSLKAPPEFIHQETIIKGDEKEPIISFASIVAKVSRDILMKKISKKFSLYGLDIHKGYGTLMHRKAIRKHGPSEIHRKSFLRNIL